MIAEEIVDFLNKRGFNSTLTLAGCTMTVEFAVGGESVTLLHVFPENGLIEQLPTFILQNPGQFDVLAHVISNTDESLGGICVGDSESVSVNFEVPEIAYEYSLNRHIALITKSICDPAWNRQELLREFHSNWQLLCDNVDLQTLYCARAQTLDGTLITKAPHGCSKLTLASHFMTLDEQSSGGSELKSLKDLAKWEKRSVSGKSVALTLETLSPAPAKSRDMGAWYLGAITDLTVNAKTELHRFSKQKSKVFWVFFTAPISTGPVRCSIRFTCSEKKSLPQTVQELESWQLLPINVRSMDKEVLLPRSGAVPSLNDKSILLVGCGSVGCEVADGLAVAGIGSLKISDPDNYSIDNLHRHTLTMSAIGASKSRCVSLELERHYPWLATEYGLERLQDMSNVDTLNQYDLVVVAIGSPTVERIFHQYVASNPVNTPVIYVWLEGYGIGGHAVLDIPESTGCLRCAYVDPETCGRGLASNLNFIAPNQDITVTQGGCGLQFIPYGGGAAKTTAAMASDLAVRYLLGRIDTSSKVSWKGDDHDALSAELRLTYRYSQFNSSLTTLSLFNSECDICGG